MVWFERDLKAQPVPTSLPWSGLPLTRSDCWGPHPTWPWMPPEITSSLSSLFPSHTTLWVKSFLLICNLNLPLLVQNCSSCPITIRPFKKSVHIFFISPVFFYWRAAVRSPWGLFYVKKSPAPSAWIWRGAPALWSTFWPASGPAPTAPHPSCARGPRLGCIILDAASQGQNRGG